MSSFRRRLTWLLRRPRLAGYGVQSPFAYQFIRGVVYRSHGFASLCHHIHVAFPDHRLVVLNTLDSGPVGLQNLYEICLSSADDKMILLVFPIRGNTSSRLLWLKTVDDNRTTVTFDLYDCGVAFFDPKIIKRNYKVMLPI